MSTLRNLKFETAAERKSALEHSSEQVRKLATVDRTQLFYFINNSTNYDVKIALAQGLAFSDVPPGIPSGYVERTGIIVIATEVAPGQRELGNVDASINCLATKATCSIIWRYRPTGYEDSLDLADQIAPSGGYWVRQGWQIIEPSSRTANQKNPPPPVVQFMGY
jgi:hypothetical protein